MSRGLGKIERDILLAVYARQVTAKSSDMDKPIMRRDELPEALWGWRPYQHWRWQRRVYLRELYPDYAAKQAALTRALYSLERKGLINTGNQYMTDGRRIFSERQAAARGIAPAKTIRERHSDDELDKIRHHMFTGAPFRLRNRRDLDVRSGRNVKTLRLTETGMLQAAALLSVKYETRGQYLTLTEEAVT